MKNKMRSVLHHLLTAVVILAYMIATAIITLGIICEGRIGHSSKWVRIEGGATPLSSKKEGPPYPFV
jgi:hypothetical protein